MVAPVEFSFQGVCDWFDCWVPWPEGRRPSESMPAGHLCALGPLSGLCLSLSRWPRCPGPDPTVQDVAFYLVNGLAMLLKAAH